MPMPQGHPRGLGGDAAEADQAERLAAELRASVRSHWPARMPRSIAAKPRAAANSRPIAHSATAVSP